MKTNITLCKFDYKTHKFMTINEYAKSSIMGFNFDVIMKAPICLSADVQNYKSESPIPKPFNKYFTHHETLQNIFCLHGTSLVTFPSTDAIDSCWCIL